MLSINVRFRYEPFVADIVICGKSVSGLEVDDNRYKQIHREG